MGKKSVATTETESKFKSQSAIDDAVKSFAATKTKEDVIEFVDRARKTVGLKAAANIILGRTVAANGD